MKNEQSSDKKMAFTWTQKSSRDFVGDLTYGASVSRQEGERSWSKSEVGDIARPSEEDNRLLGKLEQ